MSSSGDWCPLEQLRWKATRDSNSRSSEKMIERASSSPLGPSSSLLSSTMTTPRLRRRKLACSVTSWTHCKKEGRWGGIAEERLRLGGQYCTCPNGPTYIGVICDPQTLLQGSHFRWVGPWTRTFLVLKLEKHCNNMFCVLPHAFLIIHCLLAL